MKTYLYTFITFIFLQEITFAQYPIATERWSTPKIIESVKKWSEDNWNRVAEVSSVTSDGKRLYSPDCTT